MKAGKLQPTAVQTLVPEQHSNGGSAPLNSTTAEIKRIDRELDTLLDLILKGGAADRINAKMVALEARKKKLVASSTMRRSHLPCCIPIWQNIIMRRSLLSTASWAMKKREHRRPTNSARWSAASISCPIVRNW